MKITYIAQSGFIIQTDNITIGIDLWINNPINPVKAEDLPAFDYLFCTHDHRDHGYKDMIELSRLNNSKVVAVYELANHIQQFGLVNVVPCNMGGEFKIDGLTVFVTKAEHTAEFGVPVGFIIQVEGKTIYHMGDTAYFGDLAFYKERYDIDILFVPIGSLFTMGPKEASYAVKSLQPKTVIPMHYDTFQQIDQDPNEFAKLIPGYECLIIAPGDSLKV